jgi:hypothetical protein
MHAVIWDKSCDTKGSFYEALQSVYDQLPKYDRKILSGDFTVKVQDTFKQTIQNESLHEPCNENGVTVVNFAT